MSYTNLEDYILKNMNGMYGEFKITVTNCSERSPGAVLASIIPINQDTESAEFYINTNDKVI